MKKLQRHWQVVAVVSLALVLGAAVWWRGSVGQAALVQESPSYDALSEVQHDAIVGLLKDVALDRDALIALNPSGEQAESILSTVRTWQANNAATLAARQQTVGRKINAVRQLEKAIRVGPPVVGRDSELAIARQELASARAAYVSALTPLKADIAELLSQSQQTTWRAIESGYGQSMPLRMVSLTDQQRIDLSKAQRRYERQRAAASNAQELNSAVSAWESSLSQVLTNDQKTVLSAYDSHYAAASEAVADAVSTVLAVDEG